jgi:hypothetical protein
MCKGANESNIGEVITLRDHFFKAVLTHCRKLSKSEVAYHLRGEYLYIAFSAKSGVDRNKADDIQVSVAKSTGRKIYCDPHETAGIAAVYRVIVDGSPLEEIE